MRASQERDADAGDRSNDALRVTAAELRAKVVGEGANLGFTQAARIEFALNGGRINTDAIDFVENTEDLEDLVMRIREHVSGTLYYTPLGTQG